MQLVMANVSLCVIKETIEFEKMINIYAEFQF